jgi:chromosome segregation ATPase
VNLVGKIFTVLIFVLSLAFMTLAVMVYATHRNWQTVVENAKPSLDVPLGLKPQLQDLQNQKTALTDELDRTKEEIKLELAARVDLLAKLEKEYVELQQDRRRRKDAKDALTDDLRKAVGALQDAETETTGLDKDIAQLRANVETAEQDRRDIGQKVLQLTDEDQQLRNEIRILRGRQATLSADLAKARKLPRP